MGTDFYMQLLSAGVVVAIVEGFFSIIIAHRNNKLLKEQTKSEQQFEIKKTQYDQLTKAYNELLDSLPEEKKLSHAFSNTKVGTAQLDEDNVGLELAKIGSIAAEEEMLLYNHYQKYGYLLNEEQISKIQSIIEDHDEKAKAEDTMWLLTVVQFEDEYTQALRDKMVELTKI